MISIHGLRHTHASLLLFAGVSIASVSKRLGHASMNTTQETYLHVIRELENKDVDIVMRALSTLFSKPQTLTLMKGDEVVETGKEGAYSMLFT